MVKCNIAPIGTKVFLVHKNYTGTASGKVVPCRIKTYEMVNSTVKPICQIIGEKKILSDTMYNVFFTIADAVNSLNKDEDNTVFVESKF